MATNKERQRFIRYWQETTGNSEIDMNSVAALALKMGWDSPEPISPADLLAKKFKDAAKQDIRHDKATGKPYKAYHAVPKATVDGQLTFSYIDIDDPKATPGNFRKACVMRREQTVDDLLQLRLDQTHWNDNRAPEQQVDMLPADLEFDVELRIAAMDIKKAS